MKHPICHRELLVDIANASETISSLASGIVVISSHVSRLYSVVEYHLIEEIPTSGVVIRLSLGGTLRSSASR